MIRTTNCTNRLLHLLILSTLIFINGVVNSTPLHLELRARELAETCSELSSGVAEICEQCSDAFPETTSLWRCCHDSTMHSWCVLALASEDDGTGMEDAVDLVLGKRVQPKGGRGFKDHKVKGKRGFAWDDDDEDGDVDLVLGKRVQPKGGRGFKDHKVKGKRGFAWDDDDEDDDEFEDEAFILGKRVQPKTSRYSHKGRGKRIGDDDELEDEDFILDKRVLPKSIRSEHRRRPSFKKSGKKR